MDYKKLGFGLGVFSVGLGALELAAPGRISRWLGLDEDGPARTVIAAFGVRELVAGAMLLRSPADSFNVWNRVFGDTLDAAALLLALGRSNRKGAVAGALAFVGGAAALDAWTARGLDKQTGQAFPLSYGQSDLSRR